MDNSFSIIIPIHGTRDGVRPVVSLLNQHGTDNENLEVLIVEDDNAKFFPFSIRRSSYLTFPHGSTNLVRVVSHHDKRLERAISLNEGMAAAKNDWILHLDSDDEFLSTTLYNLNYCINRYPDYKLFHWGGIVMWEPKSSDEPDYDPRTTIRPTPNIPDGNPGMGYFPTGLVASGHFMFHRSVYEELGGYPSEMSPYSFADRAAEEFPEMRTMMNEMHVDSIGNPWGQDYYLFYKYTRKYKSKALPLNLYLQHVRR